MNNSKTNSLIFGAMAVITFLLLLILAIMWKLTGDTRERTRKEYMLFENDLFQQSTVANKSMFTLYKIIHYSHHPEALPVSVEKFEILTRATILHLSASIEINKGVMERLPEDDPLLLKDNIQRVNTSLSDAAKWMTALNSELGQLASRERLFDLITVHHDRMQQLVDVLNDNLNIQSQIQSVFFSSLKNNISDSLQRINVLLFSLLPLFMLNIILLLLHLNTQRKSRRELVAAHDDLERRVDERTMAFKVLNRQLQKEVEERKASEASLLESELRFRSLATASPVGIFETSMEGRVSYVNQKMCELTGQSSEVLLDHGWKQAIHPGDREMVMTHWGKTVGAGGELNVEFRLQPTNDEVVWVSGRATPVLSDKNQHAGYVGTLANITDIKLAEASLRESEEKYRSMMEAMKDGVYICSPDYAIEYMNPAMVREIGRNAVGEQCHRVIFDNSAPCDWCVFDTVKAGRCVEYELVHPGNLHHYLVSNSPIPHEDGSCSKLSIFHDVTDIKNMETRLYQARKMESIGTLTGGIAHDFNNILGIIIGNTELALDDVPEWNPAHFNLEEIKTAGLRAKNIVRQLLSFSRVSEQRLHPVDIVAIIKDALKLMRSIIPATIDIRHAFHIAEGTVLANPTQINQVMINLCTNAAQEMEKTGGQLDINVQSLMIDKENTRRYGDLATGPYIMLSVKDSGPGIRPEIIDRVFEPYFSTKEVGKGAGMGLAVAHGIINDHNGKILVESLRGEGATFTILLPQTDANDTLAKAGANETLPVGNESILLVDDEVSIIAMTGNILRRLGYEVETTTSPTEALDLIHSTRHPFDLLITDMTMPEMTGAGLSREVLAMRPDMPIIICTGHSALMDESRARELGIAAFLMKPVDKRELSVVVRQVLDRDVD